MPEGGALDLSLKGSPPIVGGAVEAKTSWLRLLRSAWGDWQPHFFALADQAVVSGASFATTVVVARWTDPRELGLYSIAVSVVVMLLTAQESFVSLPYTIQRHDQTGTEAERAGRSVALSGLISILSAAAMLTTALSLSATNADPGFVVLIAALAAVLPFALLREFGRRFALTHLRSAEALLLDVAAVTVQLAALGWLGWTGRMSSAAACAALGGAGAFTGFTWLYLNRRNFSIRVNQQLLVTARQNWTLGKWLFVGQIIGTAQNFAGYWLLALMLDTAATGVFAACMSVVSFTTPLMIGLCNILTPRAVLAFRQGGLGRLRRQALRDTVLLVGSVALLGTAIAFGGETIMRLLYHGVEYEGQGLTITVLVLAAIVWSSGAPPSNALNCIERPRALVWASLVGAALTVGVAWWLVQSWGVVGVACGFLVGNLANATGRWWAFLRLVPERPAAE
jgi:O-antigen/teichoic acid export membrane protein